MGRESGEAVRRLVWQGMMRKVSPTGEEDRRDLARRGGFGGWRSAVPGRPRCGSAAASGAEESATLRPGGPEAWAPSFRLSGQRGPAPGSSRPWGPGRAEEGLRAAGFSGPSAGRRSGRPRRALAPAAPCAPRDLLGARGWAQKASVRGTCCGLKAGINVDEILRGKQQKLWDPKLGGFIGDRRPHPFPVLTGFLCFTVVVLGRVMAVPFVEDWDLVQTLGEGAYGE